MTEVRLTRRGKAVAGTAWIVGAWILADILPFWWLNL